MFPCLDSLQRLLEHGGEGFRGIFLDEAMMIAGDFMEANATRNQVLPERPLPRRSLRAEKKIQIAMIFARPETRTGQRERVLPTA